VVSHAVKTRGPTPAGNALLLSFVETLQARLESDADLQTACASLRRLGLSPLVHVELVHGMEGPRALVASSRAGVSQWSEKDVELLRSVGIASEPGTDADPDLSQPRRRQPR
jgi:hypothetical protein